MTDDPSPHRPTDQLRATDMDRAEVGALLDRAYAEGQLDTREHDQRLAAAMTAKARGNLLVLLRDLQVEQPEFAVQPGSAAASGMPGGPGAPERTRADALVPSRNPSVVVVVVVVAVVTLVIVGAVTALALFAGSSDSRTDSGVVQDDSGRNGSGEGASGDDRNAPADADDDGTGDDRQTAVAPAVPAEDAGGSGDVADSGADGPDDTLKVSTYEMETSIRGDYLNDQGHIPDAVTCPDPLDVEVGASVRCTVSDHGASFPTTVTVIGVQGSNVTYNVSIQGVW